jgi:hypothetical protein
MSDALRRVPLSLPRAHRALRTIGVRLIPRIGRLAAVADRAGSPLTMAGGGLLAFAVLGATPGTLAARLAAVGVPAAVLWPGVLAALLLPLVVVATIAPSAQPVVTTICAALLIGAIVRVAIGRVRPRPAYPIIAVLVAALVASVVFPVASLPASTDAQSELLGLLAGLAVLAGVAAYPPRAHAVAVTVLVSGVLAAGYVSFTGPLGDGRLSGLGLNPNYLGSFMIAPVIAAVALSRRTGKARWLVVASPCVAILFASHSRGALLATAAGVAYAVCGGVPWRRTATIGAFLLVLPLTGSSVFNMLERAASGPRTVTELSRNNDIRVEAGSLAAQTMLDYPGRGIGFGMFAPYAAEHPALGVYINTHNDLARLGAESGLAALLAFLALLVLGLACRDVHRRRLLGPVVVGYVVSLLFANTLTNLLVTASYWVCLGALLAPVPERADAPP